MNVAAHSSRHVILVTVKMTVAPSSQLEDDEYSHQCYLGMWLVVVGHWWQLPFIMIGWEQRLINYDMQRLISVCLQTTASHKSKKMHADSKSSVLCGGWSKCLFASLQRTSACKSMRTHVLGESSVWCYQGVAVFCQEFAITGSHFGWMTWHINLNKYPVRR